MVVQLWHCQGMARCQVLDRLRLQGLSSSEVHWDAQQISPSLKKSDLIKKKVNWWDINGDIMGLYNSNLVCLEIWYSGYSFQMVISIGIMMTKKWMEWGTLSSDQPKWGFIRKQNASCVTCCTSGTATSVSPLASTMFLVQEFQCLSAESSGRSKIPRWKRRSS